MSHTDILTADGRSAVSLLVLARLIGCHRDQFREWRRKGAPADLDLRAWHTWLESTHRWTFAATLAKVLPELPDPAPAGDEAPAAPPKAAPAETKEAADQRYARLRADKIQREIDEMDGRLVSRDLLERVVARLSAVVVDRLQRGIWDQLLSALDAATPDTRRACRDAHDRAILAMRNDLGAAAVRRVLTEIMPTKEKS